MPSTVAMNHVGEKPWNPLRFDVYPDAQGAATGSLYEDDGVSPAYRKGVFRRTTVHYTSEASRVLLTLDAPAGSHQPPPRNFEFILHDATTITVVQLDGRPLAKIISSASAVGWFCDASGAVVLRLSDDGRAHTFELH
jgi:hypothetical protein